MAFPGRSAASSPAGHAEGIGAAAVFWYVTVAVYAVIWYAIYVTK